VPSLQYLHAKVLLPAFLNYEIEALFGLVNNRREHFQVSRQGGEEIIPVNGDDQAWFQFFDAVFPEGIFECHALVGNIANA
jgi:hypothetical protein